MNKTNKRQPLHYYTAEMKLTYALFGAAMASGKVGAVKRSGTTT